MKKFLLFMCALLGTVGAMAGVVTDRTSAGDPMTFSQFQAFAGTGKHFAIVGSSSNTQFCYPNWFGFSKTFAGTLTPTHLFDLESSATGDGWYNIKRVSDGLYVSTEGGNFAEDPKMDFKLVNRIAGDYASEFSSSDLHVSLDNAAGNHYNCNTSNLGFRGGTGGYSTYITYGPFYLVTVNCVDESNTPLQDPVTYIVTDGTTVNAPEILGKVAQGTTSVTVNGADAVLTVSYAASSFNYTVVVNGAVDGTTITVKGETVSNGASITSDDAVTESDVVVTFPTDYSYMSFDVAIEGTTITIDCYDGRWPVNFPRTQTFTRSDRHINSVTFDIEGEDQTLDGLYENTSTLCYQDLTATKTVTLPTETSVITTFSIAGIWQHGFVYIDLNNDGDYTDDGELVAKINEGNPGSNFSLPEFTTPDTEGTYRMRIKTDWSSEDPGGNPGNPNNYIIDNGGMIVDVTLVIFRPSCHVTYVVKDTGGKTLFTSEPVATSSGTIITTLPASYQRADFYTYNEVNVTISNSGNTNVEFTATPKDDAPVKYTADATDPVWYKMKLKDANYPTYVADGEENVQSPTTDANDQTVQWAFIGEPYAGFQIINRAAGTGLVLGSATTIGITDSGASVHVSLAAPGTRAKELWYITKSTYLTGGFFIYNGDGHALNQRSTGYLAYWTNGADLGSTFTVTEVHEGEELYNELIAQLQAINFGTGLNQYSFTGDYAGYTSQAATIISGLETQGYNEENLAVAQALLANYALNMPSAGFYRIKGNTSGMYLAEGMASNNKFAMSDATDASTVFYFDGTILTNFGSGMCNGVTASVWAWVTEDEASTVEFQDGLTNGGYAIKTATAHFYDNGDNGSADRGGNVSINSSTNARYTNWYLEAVTTLPVAISDVKYATLYAPVALTIPADVTAYTVTDGETAVTMTEITDGVVPANVGVVLAGEEGTYDFAFSSEAGSATSGLTGCLAAATRPDGSYILSDGTSGVGFYKDGPETVVGFKAYLPASGDSGQQVKAFLFDTPTAISGMNHAGIANGTIYNLAGQRVNKAQKGIYIVNGRKVLVEDKR